MSVIGQYSVSNKSVIFGEVFQTPLLWALQWYCGMMIHTAETSGGHLHRIRYDCLPLTDAVTGNKSTDDADSERKQSQRLLILDWPRVAGKADPMVASWWGCIWSVLWIRLLNCTVHCVVELIFIGSRYGTLPQGTPLYTATRPPCTRKQRKILGFLLTPNEVYFISIRELNIVVWKSRLAK